MFDQFELKGGFQMDLKNHELFVESVIDEPGSRAL